MPESTLSRRDFLKTLALVSLAPTMNSVQKLVDMRLDTNPSTPNIIILLFDTLSAKHVSLYGYVRDTTPNLSRFAERANVYHAHYAAANFTTPSTASLFSGTYPWTHRAFHQAGIVLRDKSQRNFFSLLGEQYYKLGFSQNLWADILMFQFEDDIDRHLEVEEFSLLSNIYYNSWLSGKPQYAFRAFDETLFRRPGSLFLSLMKKIGVFARQKTDFQQYIATYPRGIPNLVSYDLFYLLESVFDGVIELLVDLPLPSLAYIHLFSPHEPYFPRKDFIGIFDDGWAPEPKVPHELSDHIPESELRKFRMEYDEYIAHTDAEFGRVFDVMENTGLLDNSYVIVTSDHGQLFERGVHGHASSLLYDPLIHIPLIISSPKQRARKDFSTLTSTVDIVPTLMYLSGNPVPDWCEGEVLPGLGGNENPDRSVYALDAKSNPVNRPLENMVTAAIRNGDHKLISYIGYEEKIKKFELFNLRHDPEEREDIYNLDKNTAASLQFELQTKLDSVNRLYR